MCGRMHEKLDGIFSDVVRNGIEALGNLLRRPDQLGYKLVALLPECEARKYAHKRHRQHNVLKCR